MDFIKSGQIIDLVKKLPSLSSHLFLHEKKKNLKNLLVWK